MTAYTMTKIGCGVTESCKLCYLITQEVDRRTSGEGLVRRTPATIRSFEKMLFTEQDESAFHRENHSQSLAPILVHIFLHVPRLHRGVQAPAIFLASMLVVSHGRRLQGKKVWRRQARKEGKNQKMQPEKDYRYRKYSLHREDLIHQGPVPRVVSGFLI